jgi:hypothetical protein
MTIQTGHPLRLWRFVHGVSALTLAKQTGVPDYTIFRLERWKRVTESAHRAVEDFCGIDLPQEPAPRGRPSKNSGAT